MAEASGGRLVMATPSYVIGFSSPISPSVTGADIRGGCVESDRANQDRRCLASLTGFAAPD